MLGPCLNSYFEVPTELPSPTCSPQLFLVFGQAVGFGVQGFKGSLLPLLHGITLVVDY